MATVYIVGTPIGNLEDITLRALRVLKEVDIIACEDTRVTKKLLQKYDIQNKKLIAYNEQKSGASVQKIVALLDEGSDVALVTDAGTPAISDPGSRVVRAARDAEHTVTLIPGPSAITAALSVSGLSADQFLFLGFLPHKKGRETLFQEIATTRRTIVFYESPHRILKTLISLEKHLPHSRQVVVCRELSKMHEEVISGTAEEVRDYFVAHPERVRGEYVVIVG